MNSLWLSDAVWRSRTWVNIGSGNGLLSEGTKSLPGTMLTYHHINDHHWHLAKGNFVLNYSYCYVSRGQWVKDIAYLLMHLRSPCPAVSSGMPLHRPWPVYGPIHHTEDTASRCPQRADPLCALPGEAVGAYNGLFTARILSAHRSWIPMTAILQTASWNDYS